MSGTIRASRVVAILILAIFVWNDLSSNSPLGDLALAASEPPQRTVMAVRGGARPPNPAAARPDVIAVLPRLSPSPVPTALPAPPLPSASPTAEPPVDLGVFKVTAYSDSAVNGTDGRGITKSGERTHWGVVAVDPRVIPLGSRLRIEGMGETVFTALDTGGGIVGRWVDVWYHTDDEALEHGVKYYSVRVIPTD